MTNYFNYFLTSKNSRLINGHIQAEELYQKIMDHDGSTAYCCYFDLDYDKLKLEYDTGKTDRDGKKLYEYNYDDQAPSDPSFECTGKTFSKYEGICRPALNMISFDFDSDGDPQKSLDDVRKFVEWLDIPDLAVFFSGSKGFHIMVPFGYFPLVENEHLPNQLKDLAKHLKNFFPTLDDSIYNYNRKFRVPFSKHEKGLFKTLIPLSALFQLNMEDIKDGATSDLENIKIDFLTPIDPYSNREKSQVLIEAIELSARKSYEIEKDRAGTIEAPSPFEKYDNKLCIQKMLASTCEDVGRNNAAIRLVNDYFRTGKPRTRCEDDLHKWASNNDLPASEVSEIISNIYDRGANYNFGCQDEAKSVYCSAKCSIWKKLAPDKRPVTVDMPKSAAQAENALKSEFQGVQWLMEKIFGCFWDEETKKFSMGFIIKQDAKELFYYKDNFWQYLDEAKIHDIKTRLNFAYENKLTTRRLDAVFKMFIMYVPAKPDEVNLFAPRNDTSNFKDGTLHLERSTDGYILNFKKHDKLDFCTTLIDQNYRDYMKDRQRKNKVFEEWLLDCLEGDKESFKLVQEMFGASLMPRFPQFFVLIGKSGTGKSTTIKILKQLHKNEENISGVSPDKFHGFHMQSMIGKLMNIVNDIKTNANIDDDIVKQVDDQDLVRIERKSKDDVYTRLPALHVFGANRMPKTGEGYSGAMGRRFSFVPYNKVYEGKKNTDIAKDIFETDPLGILCFALRGLRTLVETNGGEYTKTTKSQKDVDEWSKKGDYVWSFLNDLQEEGIDVDGKCEQIELISGGKIKRSLVWKMFAKWQEEAIESRNQWGKTQFLEKLNDAGFVKRKSGGDVYILGIMAVLGDDDEI